ncbi:hypothetical protein BV22DRAFT_1131813 [Leucogyrophana mollusca]|uniref:Uncharacterized protein n=1 Tax=Leucogyrophana mollusca TaxID=85980 RepID=A0ACB8B8I5_9AGAM|nr:hypothetical protein BV22DRAFT_1131813 [Leucogyrophana mollusca]
MSYFAPRGNKSSRPSRSSAAPAHNSRLGQQSPPAPANYNNPAAYGCPPQGSSAFPHPDASTYGLNGKPPAKGNHVCQRCHQPFRTADELDRHSFACGAAAIITGMMTPYGYPHPPTSAHLPSPPHDQPCGPPSHPRQGFAVQPSDYPRHQGHPSPNAPGQTHGQPAIRQAQGSHVARPPQ